MPECVDLFHREQFISLSFLDIQYDEFLKDCYMVNDFQTGLQIALGFTGSLSEFIVNEALESPFFFYPKSLHLNCFVEITDLIQAEQETFYDKVFFSFKNIWKPMK